MTTSPLIFHRLASRLYALIEHHLPPHMPRKFRRLELAVKEAERCADGEDRIYELYEALVAAGCDEEDGTSAPNVDAFLTPMRDFVAALMDEPCERFEAREAAIAEMDRVVGA